MPNHFFSQNGLTACCTDTSITLFLSLIHISEPTRH